MKNENVKIYNIPYYETISSLFFATRITRQDFEFAVNKISQFLK